MIDSPQEMSDQGLTREQGNPGASRRAVLATLLAGGAALIGGGCGQEIDAAAAEGETPDTPLDEVDPVVGTYQTPTTTGESERESEKPVMLQELENSIPGAFLELLKNNTNTPQLLEELFGKGVSVPQEAVGPVGEWWEKASGYKNPWVKIVATPMDGVIYPESHASSDEAETLPLASVSILIGNNGSPEADDKRTELQVVNYQQPGAAPGIVVNYGPKVTWTTNNEGVPWIELTVDAPVTDGSGNYAPIINSFIVSGNRSQ